MDSGTPPGSEDPFELCPNGELMHYSLSSVSPLPDASALELVNLPQSAQIWSASESAGARLDLCKEGESISLRAILWQSSTSFAPLLYRLDETVTEPVHTTLDLDIGTIFETRVPVDHLMVTGLDEALTGNLDPLEIRILGEGGMLALGHDGFIAMASGRVTQNSIEYTSIVVMVGGLEPGDSFAGRVCLLGEEPAETSFNLGTASFEVKACTFLGGGHTTGYRIFSLAVQDDSPELSEAGRQRVEFNSQEEVESVMNYVWNHHNGCDSFYLNLPHAQYAATAAPLAGCGISVEHAPMRTFDDDRDTILYRVKYEDGPWQDRVVSDCSHYMFCDR